MFKDNKYYRWYLQIVSRAKHRDLGGYFETHHIVPKSLGGSDLDSNLVKLTAREHFICHWLLTKFVLLNVEKMQYSLWMMMNVENKSQNRYKVNSRTYEILKSNLSKIFSNQHSGRKLTEETKRKISETRKKKFQDGTLKINVYDTTREKHSKNRLGRPHCQETKDKIGDAHRGKELSSEQRQLLSKANTGKQWTASSKEKLSNTLKNQYDAGDRQPVKGMLGKKLSSEARNKISNALRGKKKPARSEEYKQAQSKRIKEWWATRKKNND